MMKRNLDIQWTLEDDLHTRAVNGKGPARQIMLVLGMAAPQCSRVRHNAEHESILTIYLGLMVYCTGRKEGGIQQTV